MHNATRLLKNMSKDWPGTVLSISLGLLISALWDLAAEADKLILQLPPPFLTRLLYVSALLNIVLALSCYHLFRKRVCISFDSGLKKISGSSD